MNLSELAVAYSPTSPVLDDVIRNAVINLLVDNMRDLIPILIENLPDLPEIVLPPNIDINSTAIVEFIKSRIRVDAYNSSYEIRGLYIDEETTRSVIAAVEFDDKLYG